jgi:hypothetical protein
MGHLSMVNWDCLNSLKLGSYLSMQIKIKFGDKGSKYLSRVRLDSIKFIHLCTQYFI